jgi:shikimate dehydrogenase
MEECFAFSVTGNPILHSKSPLMFNALFQQQSKAFKVKYIYGRIAASTAEEAVYLFRQLNLKGMNVTAPFKKEIMDHLDIVDTPAIRIGGVNTVVRQENGLMGYNTDYIGVVESLKARDIEIENRCILILGAGGAGRAAAYGLAVEGAKLVILNRTYSKAVEVAKMTGGRAENFDTLETQLKYAHVLVSTLAVDIDIVPGHWLKKELTVFDANYKHSALLQKAQQKGCTVIRGEEWLLNQAIPAYRYFTGTTPSPLSVEIMKKTLTSPAPVKPLHIALVGFMASGKTMIGKLLAHKMGLPFKDIDHLIEEQEEMSIPDIFKKKGEAYFREMEHKVLKQQLETSEGTVFACGGGAVLDDRNKILLQDHALVVWLYSSIKVTLERLEPGTRPLLDKENPAQEAHSLLQKRIHLYGRCVHLVVNSEHSAHTVAEKIYEEIDKTFGY